MKGLDIGNIENITDFLLNNCDMDYSKIALVNGNNSISYRELIEQVNNYTKKFIELGVKEKSNVVLNMSKTPEYPIILLALLKIGSVIIPIDVEYPLDRYINILNTLKIKLFILSEDSNNGLKDKFQNLFSVESYISLEELIKLPILNKLESKKIQDIEASGYIMFTSGTTGDPKAVFINQKNMIFYILSLSDRLDFVQNHKFLHLASISFSSSIRQFLLPIIGNFTNLLLCEEKRKDLSELIDVLISEQITILDITPSHLSAMLSCISENEDLLKKIKSHRLSVILTASEVLSKDLVEKTINIFGKVGFINMYGQTETSGIIATENVDMSLNYKNFIHIGFPLECITIEIFEENGFKVIDGEVGEICVYGSTLSQNILTYNDDSSNFFSYGEGIHLKKYYRTGDLGRKLSDGKIEFCGRKSSFIKINASRVSLEEIKQNLLLLSYIQEAEVIALNKENGSSEIAAVVVLRSNNEDKSSIRSFLQKKLPTYMVPNHIKIVKEIPVNQNFKVNYQEILSLFQKKDASVEEVILNVWKKVFVLDNISKHEDFYSLGGNSLIAARIAIQINSLLCIKLKITDVLNHYKLEHLVEIVKKKLVSQGE